MKTIAGEIKLLGNSTINKGVTEYSVIEIGDTILRNMFVTAGLDNYVQRGLTQDGECTIHFLKHKIMGIHLPDGKLYCEGEPFGTTFFIFWIILSIFAIPFFGLGLVSLWQVYQAWGVRTKSKELQAIDGIVV